MEDIIGIIGVGLILFAYFSLQIEKISSKGLAYSVINLVGSVMILYSLMFNWNLPSVIIEIFWMAISIYGLYKYFSRKKFIIKELNNE